MRINLFTNKQDGSEKYVQIIMHFKNCKYLTELFWAAIEYSIDKNCG